MTINMTNMLCTECGVPTNVWAIAGTTDEFYCSVECRKAQNEGMEQEGSGPILVAKACEEGIGGSSVEGRDSEARKIED